MKANDPTFRVLLLLVGLPAWSSAQSGGPWSITSSTLDGGGGRSTGGPWTLTGTIGQPDASVTKSTGGIFSIQGGFWPGVLPSAVTGGGPALTISAGGAGNASLAWPAEAAGYQLQYSTDLQNWSNQGSVLTGAGGLSWPLATGPRYFFRLIQ